MPQPETKQREHMTIHVAFDLQKKLRDYSYWERKTIKEIVNEIFTQFFSDKQVQSAPAAWHRTKKTKTR